MFLYNSRQDQVIKQIMANNPTFDYYALYLSENAKLISMQNKLELLQNAYNQSTRQLYQLCNTLNKERENNSQLARKFQKKKSLLDSFIDCLLKLIAKRQPTIQDSKYYPIVLKNIENSLQKMVAEVMYYESLAIKATIHKNRTSLKDEEVNACYYLDSHQHPNINSRQRFEDYNDEQQKLCDLAQKYKNKKYISRHTSKHSDTFNQIYQDCIKLTAEVEKASMIINQIKSNIHQRKSNITFSNCSLYNPLQALMRQISSLYQASNNNNARTSQYYSGSSYYCINDGVSYDKLSAFVDRLYQSLAWPQQQLKKISKVKFGEKVRFIEKQISNQQSYQLQRRQQVEQYASKINKVIPEMLKYLGKQAAQSSIALHVFSFDLKDLDTISQQLNQITTRQNSVQKVKNEKGLQQYDRIKQYFNDNFRVYSLYFKPDKRLFGQASIQQAIKIYCEGLKTRIRQLIEDMKQEQNEKKRQMLLNCKEKVNVGERDEIQQMNSQFKTQQQQWLTRISQLQTQLEQIHKQHSSFMQCKDRQIQQLQNKNQILERDLAKAKEQTQNQVLALKIETTTTASKNRELEKEICTIKAKLQCEREQFKSTLKKEIDKKQEENKQKQVREKYHQYVIKQLKQFYDKIRAQLQEQHRKQITAKDNQLSHLTNRLQEIQNVNQQNMHNIRQLTHEEHQLQHTNMRLSAQLEQNKLIIAELEQSIKLQQQKKEQALRAADAQFAKKIKQLCNNQQQVQLQVLAQTYQTNMQQLKKQLQQKQQALQFLAQEKTSLVHKCCQIKLKIEQLLIQNQNVKQQNRKLQEKAQFEKEQLIAETNWIKEQLKHKEQQLAEISQQLERQQSENKQNKELHQELTEKAKQMQFDLQAQIQQIQQQFQQKLESYNVLKIQIQSEKNTIEQLTHTKTYLLQQEQESQHQFLLNKYYSQRVEEKEGSIQTLKQQLRQLQDSYQQLEGENEIRTAQILELRKNIENEVQQKQQKYQQYVNGQIQQQEKLDLLSQQLRSSEQWHSLAKEREAKTNQKLQQIQMQYETLKQQFEEITDKYIEVSQRHQRELNEQIDKNLQDVSKMSEAVGNSFIDNADEQKILELQNCLKLKQQQFQNNIRRYRKQTDHQVNMLKQKIKKLEQQNRSLQQKNELVEAQAQSIATQIGALQEEKKTLSYSERYLKEEIQQLQTTIQSQQQEMQKMTVEKAKKSIIYKSDPLTGSSSTMMVPYTHSLFNQDIFEQDEQQKSILVKHIQNYIKSSINRTRIVHKYDTRNKTNFHQYIDDVPSLCIVIKTKKAIIAGLYPGTLRDKEILDKGGLLVSVTNDSSYTLFSKKAGDKSAMKGMIYDTFFAIYGNAEIRVKTGFKTVFSNFGVSNGYFNSKGDKINKFLNEGDKREVQFEYCEFYQVLFQQEINPASFSTSA